MGRILLAAAMVLAVGTRSLPAGGDGAFSLRNSLEIILGGNPDALAAGDFDRDGRLDLAATNLSGHFEIVLQDSRDREVWKRLPAEQAIGGYFLRPADFDGDGDDDLIVAVLADAAFFLRSGGDGSFAPAARVAGSLEPRWITLGDFDRDGALDVATAEYDMSLISIIRGGGDGTFSPLQGVSTNEPPNTVEALDSDGDGSLDLAAGLQAPGIILLKGDGDGTFRFLPGVVLPGCYRDLVAADFNGDGLDDLATTCSAWISRGDGTFGYAPLSGLSAPLAVADLNGDGALDIACKSFRGVAMAAGLGDGRFRPSPFFGPIGPADFPQSGNLLARDLDGDGHADLVAAGTGYLSLHLLWGRTSGFPGESVFGLTGFGPARILSIADLDVDGFPDLLIPKADEPRIRGYLHPGAGESPGELVIDSREIYTSLEPADLDGEGWLDLAGASLTRGMALVTLLDAVGEVKGRAAAQIGAWPAAVAVGRIDGDLTPDLVVASRGLGSLELLTGVERGEIHRAQYYPSIRWPGDLALGDLDGDGSPDAAVISSGEVGVHFGTSDGRFSGLLRVNRDETRRYVDLVIADVTGDGLLDLVAAEKTGGLIAFQGRRNGRFVASGPLPLSGEVISLAAGDLDGDGLTDLTISSASHAPDGTVEPLVSVLLSQDAGFGSPTVQELPLVPLGHRLADLDRDGALDLVVFDDQSALIVSGNIAPPPADGFRRGDADSDGRIQFHDAAVIVNRLFLGGEAFGCPDAADANDDGEIDLSDPIAIIFRLFLGGAPLPPPGPERCGLDATADGLAPCTRGC